MVAEVLGLPIEDIEQGVSDSDTTVFDSGMFGDRCTFWDGNAAVLAAKDPKKQLASIAAKDLGADPDALEFKNRRIYVKENPLKGMDFLLAVRKAYYEDGAPLYGRGYWAATDIDLVDWKTCRKGNLAHGLDFIATAIELEVDEETGQVRLLKSAHGDDAAIGSNCSLGSAEMIELTAPIRAATHQPVLIQPNAGKPLAVDDAVVYQQTPAEFAADGLRIKAAGADMIGGCCGTTPNFIRELAKAVC